jgi:hypothetical protein
MIMSHSEVDTWNDCQQKHHYAFEDIATDSIDGKKGLEASEMNERLRLGTMGHFVLSVYYNARKEGISHLKAAAAAIDTAGEEFMSTDYDLFLQLIPLVSNYFNQYVNESFDILFVEQTFYVPMHYIRDLDLDLYFAFKPDLIIKDPMKIGVDVVDHKFVGRFYNEDGVQTMPQMVRYGRALAEMQLSLNRCVYNMVHTKPTKNMTLDQQVCRVAFKPTHNRVSVTWADTKATMIEIAKHRLSGSTPRRQPGPMKCGMCQFKPLCITELNGDDSTVMRKYNYTMNTYGYPQVESIEVG